jgi:SNF2 family DNA or RNA helicase
VSKIWRHQQEAIEWAEARLASGKKYAIFAHGMGSGKTRTTLEFLARMMRDRGITRILVCCPKAVIPAWHKQGGLWLSGVRVGMLTKGGSKEKAKEVEAALADPSPVIIVVNYDSAWRIKPLATTKWDAIVHDEIHRLKAPTGSASKWAGKLCKNNPDAIKVGLSGTLIPHSVLDLWAIYRAMESPACETFGDSFTLHKARYAVTAQGQNWIVGYRNLDQAHRLVAATTHQVKSKDVLDLPPITYLDVECDMDSSEARLYREIEHDFCATVEAGAVTPKNALEQLLRLQQICGGYVKFDGEDKARQISAATPAKASVLADMLEDLPSSEPVVVFVRFRSDIDACIGVCQRLGRTFGELSGAANDLASFQSGAVSTLITQIQSGGIGVDMSTASYCLFYSLGYSLAEYEQAVARLHRPGQQNHTRIYHLVATIHGRQTVDGRVYKAIRERKDIVDAILAGYSGSGSPGPSVRTR